MPALYLLIRYDDGRQGAVLEAAWNDPANVPLFQHAHAGPYEDGSAFGGPFTVEDLGDPDPAPAPTPYLVVEWPADGREGGVTEEDYLDPENADLFADTIVVAWESGEPWSAP